MKLGSPELVVVCAYDVYTEVVSRVGEPMRRVSGYHKGLMPTTDAELEKMQPYFEKHLAFRDGVLYYGEDLAVDQGGGYINLFHVCTVLLEKNDEILYFDSIDSRRLLPYAIRELGRGRRIVVETCDTVLMNKLSPSRLILDLNK